VALGDQLKALAAAEALPASYPTMAERWLTPLADWLQARFEAARAPILVGVNGAQGTGKTTACAALCLMLEDRGLRAVTLGLDDFYLGKAERRALAARVHPLFLTRGVPGTHETKLLAEAVDSLLQGGSVTVPVFDKASDDRLPNAFWRELGPADVLLLEGWCIGALPESEPELAEPLNDLEAREDLDGTWRGHVNRQLAGDYAALFARLHALVMLKAPSLERVLAWRRLQEEKLANTRGGEAVMSATEVSRFVEHYERVTSHCLQEMPARADYVLEVGEDHAIHGATSR
jgi:D-glycerate 3-kinase